MRRSIYLTVAGLLLGVALSEAAQDLTITISAGAGTNVRAGVMTPVQVILENREKEYSGRVVAWFTTRESRTTIASREVEMPAGATKRLFLYLPAPQTASGIEVQYEDHRGRVISRVEERISLVDSIYPAFGGLTKIPRGLPERVDPTTNRPAYNTFYLRPDQVPDRFDGLEMYDLLFVSPTLERPLASVQVNAIEDWVLRGGILVVDLSRRSDYYQNGPLAELLPFAPLGQEQRQLSLFDREALISVGRVRGGEVVLESDGYPLVVRRDYGLGSIIGFTIELDDPALLSWPGREGLWTSLLDSVDWTPEQEFNLRAFTGEINVANSLAELVTEAPSTGLRLSLVLLLTGLYALVAGPGDYFLVRRLGRPKLTWITFPIIVAVFTLAAYFGARWWIGGDWEVKRYQRTLVFEQDDVAIRTDLTGIFVPRADNYVIEDDRDVLVRHLGDYYGLNDFIRTDQDAGRMMQRIPIWTHRTYLTSETTRDYPEIDVTVSREGDGWHVDARNASDAPVTPLYLTVGNSTLTLDETPVEAGQSRTIAVRGVVSDLSSAGASLNATRVFLGLSPLDPERDRTRRIGTSNALTMMAAPDSEGFGREFDAVTLLERGRAIVTFRVNADASRLLVDGDLAESKGAPHLVQIVVDPNRTRNVEELNV